MDKIYKGRIGGEVSPVVPTATDPTHAPRLEQVEAMIAASGGELTAADINTALGYTAADRDKLIWAVQDTSWVKGFVIFDVANDYSDLGSKIQAIGASAGMGFIKTVGGTHRFLVQNPEPNGINNLDGAAVVSRLISNPVGNAYSLTANTHTGFKLAKIGSTTADYGYGLKTFDIYSGDITPYSIAGSYGAYFWVKRFGIELKEHQINGVRLTQNISGTFAFDWNAYSQFVLTPTGAVTLSDSNLPTGINTKVISGVFKASSFAVTFPANWVAREGSSPLSATKDTFFLAETMPNGEVSYLLDNGSGSSSVTSVESFTVQANALWESTTGYANWHIFDALNKQLVKTTTTNFINAISDPVQNNKLNYYKAPFTAPFNCKVVRAEISYYNAQGRTFDFSIGTHTYTEGSAYNANLLNPALLHQETLTVATLKRAHKVITPANAIINAGDNLIYGINEPNSPQNGTIDISVQFYIQKV